MTFAELMKKTGCTKWPERWEGIFGDAMAEYENDFPYINPQFYEALEKKYEMLGDYLENFKDAAVKTAEDKELITLLKVLCFALKDRENIRNDLKEFEGPKTLDEEKEMPYNMITGLAICSVADYAYDNMKKRGIPDDVIKGVLKSVAGGVGAFKNRNGGKIGYRNFAWNQRLIDGGIFPSKRLQVEVNVTMEGYATVFRNKSGETVSLADGITLHKSGMALGSKHFEDEEGSFEAKITEENGFYVGYPYKENGRVSGEKIKLSKSEWEKVLERGDKVISLHIPAKGKLTPAEVDEAIDAGKEFVKKYFPDYDYKALYCHSWLCDPQLETILPPESNIVKFMKRFTPLTIKASGKAVFSFVFLKPDDNFEIKDLPENTTLERGIKNLCLNGGAIYETIGYIL